MSKRDLAKDLFISYKTGYIKKPRPAREVNLNPTDPQLISDVLKNFDDYLYNDVKLLILSNEVFGNNILSYLPFTFLYIYCWTLILF